MNDSLLNDLEKKYNLVAESVDASETEEHKDPLLPEKPDFHLTDNALESDKSKEGREAALLVFQKEYIKNAVCKALEDLGITDKSVVKKKLESLRLTDERITDESVSYDALMDDLQVKCGVKDAPAGDKAVDGDEEEPLEDEEETSGTGQYPPVENPEGKEEDASAVEAVEPAPQDGAEPELVTYPFEKTRYSEKSSFDKNRDNWIESKMMLLRKRGILP